jgi:hypothetical protein
MALAYLWSRGLYTRLLLPLSLSRFIYNRISSGQKRSFYDFQLICYSMWILQSWIGLTPPLSPSSEAYAEQGTLQRNTSCGICSLHGKSFENVSLYAYYAKFYQTKSCTAVGY